MFKDCKSNIEKNKYKTDKLLQIEVDEWLKKTDAEFYRAQRIGSFCDVFELICNRIEIPDENDRFIHFIDYRYLFDTTRGYRFENIAPDYACILNNGLLSLKYNEQEVTNKFCSDYNHTIDCIIMLVNRIINKKKLVTDRNSTRQIVWFENMISKPAKGFEEALQRVLFFHQIFWQIGQRLMGLGHLDMLLIEMYRNDYNKGIINQESAKEILGDFFESLHKYCWLKSNMLLGDTGQIIILGNRDTKGNYIYNELTYLFLDVGKEKKMPDPKVLLRVGKDIPRELMEAALACMSSGGGMPILSNDDIVIPRLLDFNVLTDDAYNYGVAACWEPLVPGKSISPNNMKSITYPKAMQRVWERDDLAELDTLEKWIEAFLEETEKEIQGIIDIISEARFQYNPYMSIFFSDCFKEKKDVSAGGAAYNSYGLTTVGLSNTVNTILNLKKYVYGTREYSLYDVKKMLMSNFEGYKEFRVQLKNLPIRYGNDNSEVLELSNYILKRTSEMTNGFRNYMGGRLKIGASSPSYIDASKDVIASFDGREYEEAFGVHISGDNNNGYTEIIKFASELDYNDNRFNGNVVDIMTTPSFIEHNFDKMVDLLLAGIDVGFFQLQMNVIGSEALIEAQRHPEDFKNLVVRVWGFSAYFVDLPENYQNVLINRALMSEKKAM